MPEEFAFVSENWEEKLFNLTSGVNCFLPYLWG
jgi:hypothetical protein